MKRIIKITVDIIMTMLFFVLMAYHFTGDAVHEYLGFSLFIFFILHHILNFNWYKNIYKGKYNFNRILNTFINTMLFLCMAGLMISGILFSQRVLGFLNIHNSGMFTRRLHMISNSWAFVFMSAHLGMHWGMFINRKFIKKQISIIIALFVSIYGVVSFIKRGLYNKMFLLVEFAFFDYEEPVIFFFMDYLSIMGLFIFITYCLKKYQKDNWF
ncbi:membrane protein [Brachyspira pilosicoli]|uniref:DUF4405 domain-containing protein n=1 Tax=Brachyspira pilosicoli TaxID=52584 RepID=UPI000E187C84|nr:DUF4405 domain-containing protein [Brachyspira pilosicoli]SUW09593.1 membrane protein [Brachyspira pilosicoli]